MKSRPILIFLMLLLFYGTLPAAAAVGFANLPTQTEIVFEPGRVVEHELQVTKGSNIEVGASLTPLGDPATLGTPEDNNILSYFTIDDPNPGTGPRSITVRFEMPQQMKPGVYYVDLHATNRPPGLGGTITAVASVKMRFTIHVLSSEKFVEVRGLSVPSIPEGMKTNATLYVISRTTREINNIYVEASVYDEGELVVEGLSTPRSLASSEGALLVVPLRTESLLGGSYDVNATVFFDGQSIHGGGAILKVGSLRVSVPDYTQTFLYNTTNRFVFNISNQWNRGLNEVYAVVEAFGQTKKTASHSIPPFGKTEYEVYFDRDSSALGDVPVNVTVSYKDLNPYTENYVEKTESILLYVSMMMPSTEERPAFMFSSFILYTLAGILVILLVIVLVLLVRRKQQPPQEPVV